jgi:gliding motility-associated-like protein
MKSNHFKLKTKNSNNYLKVLGFILLMLAIPTSAQNYVASGSEVVFVGSVDFSTSLSWETARGANPGFYTWVNGSTSYDIADDSRHINGYAKKVGNTSFTFPVGNGADLRSIQMSAPASATAEYAVAWIEGNPSTTPDPTNSDQVHPINATSGAINSVSTVGQWDWIAAVGTGEALTITVSIPALSGDYFTSASDVRLVGWNGTAWIALGNTPASGLTENSTLSGTLVAGIQAIGIGSIKNVSVVVAPPAFTITQNANGTLTINGTATANLEVTVSFPDGTTTVVKANAQGVFGPLSSNFPQAKQGVVTAFVTNLQGIKSTTTSVPFEFLLVVAVSEAFTPNGDGVNDTWKIYGLEEHPNTTVRVFNRWGRLVFEAKDYQNDWAGSYKDFNSILPQSSSYYYQIDYGTDGTIDKQGWLYIRN